MVITGGLTAGMTHTHVYTRHGIFTVGLSAGDGVVTDTLTRAGFITAKSFTTTTRVIGYSYDGLYRLIGAGYSTGRFETSEVFDTHDRPRLTVDFGSLELCDSADRLDYFVENGLTTDLSWDDGGNLLAQGTSVYTWDAAGRLIGATVEGGDSSFAYNGLGRRVARTADGLTTAFVLDVGSELPEVIAATTVESATYYVQIQGQLLAEVEEGTWEYALPDALGSLRQLADESGEVLLAQSFDPFGVLLQRAGWGGSEFGYTGEPYDHSTRLTFLRARYYDPGVGRFWSRDALLGDILQAQTQNPYVYGLNNPFKYLDPSGRTVRSALDLVRQYGDDIKSTAARYSIDPLLLAGVVFAENRNDYNLIENQDWTAILTWCSFGGPEIKNLLGPFLRANVSTGITEVTVAVAAMMDDRNLVPNDYGRLSQKERGDLHKQIAVQLPSGKRRSILDSLADPRTSLEYSAEFLRFLSGYRDYGEDFGLWLSDYNQGLTSKERPSEYGKLFNTYRENIQYVLNWRVTQYWASGYGVDVDQFLYGELP